MQMNKITQTRKIPVTLSEAKGLRSQASACPSRQTLRFAQGDNTLPILVGKIHYRPVGARLIAPLVSAYFVNVHQQARSETK